MKPLIIYHANCTDGYGAAFAAWLKLGDGAEYVPINYGNDYALSENTFEFKDREVYILDFSFPRNIMDMLFEGAKRVVWLDHHKTAFEMWCGEYYSGKRHVELNAPHEICLDDNKSGAMLAWLYFHGAEPPMLIQHIDDRDRWQWKLEGSAELHAALASMQPWSFEQWKASLSRWTREPLFDEPRFLTKHWGEFLNEGRAILRAQKQHVERMVKQARKCLIALDHDIKLYPHELNLHPEEPVTLPGLAVNASLHQSEVGHELANQSGTYGLVWYVADDGRVRCSLRSNGDYDVSGIARSFGGGGHRNAAGFETDIETLMGWIK